MRPIALGLAAVAAAFLIAFGIGKATNGDEATGAPSRAEAIEADDAVISAEVTTAGARLPALKEREQRPRRRQTSNESSDSSTAPQQQDSSPSQQQDTTPPSQDTSPPPKDTTPPKRDSGESGDSGGGISGGDN